MMSALIAIAAAALFALFAALYYRREQFKKKTALFLWLIRVIALALLACAFIQPSFTIKTLAKDENGVAVFIDASRSMGLFKLDSLLTRLSGLGNFSRASPKTGQNLRFFCFGDSLRPCDPGSVRSIRFTDNHSFFPTDLSSWHTIVIFSDGNWSNPSLNPDLFANKQCYFLSMPSPSPRPFLRARCISFQSPVLKDSLSAATVAIDGYKTAGQPFEISVRQGTRQVLRRLRAMDPGYFNDTLLVAFPTKNAGRFMYAIGVGNRIDSLQCLLHLIGDVTPSSFTARIVSSNPTLDARFLSLALGADPSWKTVNAGESVDALFLLDWDAASKKAFFNQKPSSMTMFIGCLPCSSGFTVTTDTLALISNKPDDSLSQRILRRKLPSPASIVAFPRSSLPSLRTAIACVARQKNSRLAQCDTLPFLCQGSAGGRGVVALASRDCWRMDFLPLGLDGENESGSLLRDVLSIVKESVLQRINGAFFMYPAASEISEFDSCAFNVILPPELNEEQGAADATPNARIDFSMRQGEHRVFDTAFAPAWGAISSARTFRCRPLPSGKYSYSARLSFEKKLFSCEDTMIVGAHDLELSIMGQNTVLLGQIATALNGNDPRLLSGVIDRNPGLQRMGTRSRTFQLNRSWLLFILIIAFFSLEWAIRRMKGLDG